MAAKKTTEEAKAVAEELLSLVGVEGRVQTREDKENEAIQVQIETDGAGILIGHHGETISAFQLLLGQILHQRAGDWSRVLVNVGDWRERREETLKGLAQSVAQRVKETEEAQPIYDLTPAERRIVHLALSEDDEVVTESEGEGRDRHLVIKPKAK